jgi:hypothetical protein
MFFRLRDAGIGRRRLRRSAAAVKVPGIFLFRRRYLGLVLLCLAELASASSAVAAPTVTLVNPAARLDYGQSEGEVQMVLQLVGLDANQLQDQKLLNENDVLSADSWPFKFVGAEPMGPPGPASMTWHVRVHLGGLPANTTQTRYLSVTIGATPTALEYTLTNKAAESFSWTIKAPPTIAIEPNQPIPISVAVGPVPANNVKLVGPYLPEKATKALIAPNGLTLCRHQSGACNGSPGDNIVLQAHSTTQLWLRGADGVGQYDGSATMACDEKPDGDTVTLSILSTTWQRQLLGVAVIFVSALLTWFITVFARNLFNRDQMLLPVPLLRARLESVQTRVRTHPAGANTPAFEATTTRLLGQLDETQLTTLGLPGKIPSPWSPSPASNQADAYRNALQGVADWLAVLETVCGDGFAVIWPRWIGATQAQQQAIIQATTTLDQLALPLTPPALDAVRQQIVSRVAAVNGAMNPMGGGAPAAAPVARSYDQLSLQIAQISMAAWIIVLLGTTVVGSMALVLNSSFGSLMDFMMCLAWGLGLPIGSQALNASFGTVGTSLGISMQR